MGKTIFKNVFVQDVTGYEITVWSREGESAFAALFCALRRANMPTEANWRIISGKSKTLRRPATA